MAKVGVCMAKGSMYGEWGVHGRGHVLQGGMCAGETATEAGDTHPTEMFTCNVVQP